MIKLALIITKLKKKIDDILIKVIHNSILSRIKKSNNHNISIIKNTKQFQISFFLNFKDTTFQKVYKLILKANLNNKKFLNRYDSTQYKILHKQPQLHNKEINYIIVMKKNKIIITIMNLSKIIRVIIFGKKINVVLIQ